MVAPLTVIAVIAAAARAATAASVDLYDIAIQSVTVSLAKLIMIMKLGYMRIFVSHGLSTPTAYIHRIIEFVSAPENKFLGTKVEFHNQLVVSVIMLFMYREKTSEKLVDR